MDAKVAERRLKSIRKELGFTQNEFARYLGVGTSTADLERGKTRIPATVCAILLRDYHINPLWLFGVSDKKLLNPYSPDPIPKAVVVDNSGKENILLVHEKAAAGYGENLGDKEFIEKLPSFDFPLSAYRNASFRGFEITGDSMVPFVNPGDWVISKAVHSLEEVRNNGIYIIVQNDGIRLKQINKKKDNSSLELHSINPEYPTIEIDTASISELWEYHSKISFSDGLYSGVTIEKVYEELQRLRAFITNKIN